MRRIQIVERTVSRTGAIREYIGAKKAKYDLLLRAMSKALKCAEELRLLTEELGNLAYAQRVGVRKHQPSIIGAARAECGSIVTDIKSIENVFRAHFERLCSANHRSKDRNQHQRITDFCEGLPTLCPEASHMLCAEAIKDEAWQTLRKINTTKAPGRDGILTGFYMTFFYVLGDALTDMVNEFIVGGQKPRSFSEGRVVLLPKKGMDPDDPPSWRPITLLNVVYRLVATILA